MPHSCIRISEMKKKIDMRREHIDQGLGSASYELLSGGMKEQEDLPIDKLTTDKVNVLTKCFLASLSSDSEADTAVFRIKECLPGVNKIEERRSQDGEGKSRDFISRYAIEWNRR